MKIGDIVVVKGKKGIIVGLDILKAYARVKYENGFVTLEKPEKIEPVNCSIGESWNRFIPCSGQFCYGTWDSYYNEWIR